MTKAVRGDAGTALVEFALIAPVLILLLVGILDLGRAMNASITLANAAREGSYYAALHPTAAPSAIRDAVRARVVPLDASAVTVEASYHDGSTFVDWPNGGIPANPSPTAVPTQVRVTYPWRATSSLIGSFFTGSPLSASSRASTVR